MLKVRDVDQTRTLLRETCRLQSASERIPCSEAVGRVLASPILADSDIPAFDRSMVDGFAVRAVDTFGASESIPAPLHAVGEIPMGSPVPKGMHVGPNECVAVPTGGAIPPGADAMVMIERVEDYGDGLRYVTHAVSPGAHMIFRGDDVRVGDEVISAGTLLLPHHIGMLAALGLSSVEVRRRLRVAVLSTGDELATEGDGGVRLGIAGDAPGEPLREGCIHDVNRPMLCSFVARHGAEPVDFGIVPDRLDVLQAVLADAHHTCDLVLVSGGSSVGVRDHVQNAIDSLGAPGVIQHGVAVKPGKPTLIGLCDGKHIIGLPGHPLAAYFMAEWLIRPLLFWMQGSEEPRRTVSPARTGCRIPSNHGREEFLLVRLAPPHPADPMALPIAYPIFSKSGLISLLSRSDGYLRIPRDCEGLEEESVVEVHPL